MVWTAECREPLSHVVVARMAHVPPTHHAGIPERVTDGQEAVIGHDGVEEATSGAAQEVEGAERSQLGKEIGLPSGAPGSSAFWAQ